MNSIIQIYKPSNLNPNSYQNYWIEQKQKKSLSITLDKETNTSFSSVALQKNINSFKIYELCVEIEDSNIFANKPNVPERHIGDIYKFSKHSRLRMLKLISKTYLHAYPEIYHVTLTFHNNFSNDHQILNNLLKRFLMKLKYRNFQFAYIWRIELQRRGAPHFHIILLFSKLTNVRNVETFRAILSKFWTEIINETSLPAQLYSVNLTKTDNPRKLFGYVSKYAAKIEDELEFKYIGRRWSYSENLIIKEILNLNPSDKLLEIIKRNIYNYLKEKNKLSEKLDEIFFKSKHLTLFIDKDEINNILLESIKELKNEQT